MCRFRVPDSLLRERKLRLLLAGRFLRSLAIGVLMISVPLVCEENKLGTTMIGMILAAGVTGALVQMQFAAYLAVRFGRLRILAVFTALMSLAAATTALISDHRVVVVVAFVGGLSMQPNISAQEPLEHAILSDRDSSVERTELFSWHNAASTLGLSFGSLAAAMHMPVPRHETGKPFLGFFYVGTDAVKVQTLVAAILLVVASFAYGCLDPQSTVQQPKGNNHASRTTLDVADHVSIRQCEHWRRIVGLCSLFAVDAFAGGLVMNSILTHWLSERRSMEESLIGTILGASGFLTVPSLFVASWLGKRIGLINTMVFTHLPANVILILLPFATTSFDIFVLLLLRAATSQMDVPARGSFMMGAVRSSERVVCSTSVTTARAAAVVGSPAVAAFLWNTFSPSAPFVVAGTLKCAYDLTLLAAFRSIERAPLRDPLLDGDRNEK
eukprot:TRINITY_DN62857_c0_g1_i1.p1 TRINITY_DN62857_c0_g1~~TRINITY_DN62857_c0_g1_i1.p1  ORF type:complete len:442 (-),score=63.88 TRINITY_DN62857_c0_g1_i1:113-1438(-)